MFAHLPNLESVVFHCDAPNTTNMSNMFDMQNMGAEQSPVLTSVDLSKLKASKVTTMYDMFLGCKTLTSLDLSSLDTSNVTTMSGMFSGCSNLKTINLSSFDTSNVTTMQNMFLSSSVEIISAKTPFCTKNVTNMAGIFAGNHLTDAAIDALGYKDFDISKVTNFDRVFLGHSLRVIDLSNWDFSNVTETETLYLFGDSIHDYSSKHEARIITMPANMPVEVLLPTNKKWYSTYDPSAEYRNTCVNADEAITYISELNLSLDKNTLTLTDENKTADLTATVSPLNITDSHVTYKSSNTRVAKVESSTGVVTALSSGTCEITVTANDVTKSSATCLVTVHLHEWSDDWIITDTHHWHECTLTSPACNITNDTQKGSYSEHIYNGGSGVICNACGYSRMDSLSLDQHSVQLTGVGDTANLTAKAMPLDIILSNVTYESSDESVATVDEEGKVTAVSNGSCTITATFKDDESYYAVCDVAVHIHNWSTDWESNGTHHWHGCMVTSPACPADNADKPGYAAHEYNDASDKTCNICGYVRKINVTGVSSDKNSVTVDKDSTSIIKAAGNAYKVTSTKTNEVAYTNGSKNAASVKIPATITVEGKTYTVTKISANAFSGNKKLTSVTIPATVKTIDKNAFKNCAKLKTISIPKNVKTIGKNAFNGCKAAKTITIKSTKISKVGASAFKGVSKKAVIKVPKKKLKAYKKLFKKAGFKGKVKK